LAFDHNFAAQNSGNSEILPLPFVEFDGVLAYYIPLVPLNQVDNALLYPLGKNIEM